ncbi:hypothetical protein UPYG_G00060400 [Umbra pygmaea]|uniref:Uncharacterized protein n=1 Tax=Umbra pygmaea TaxID=75934 RepID=A0ABD0XR51_UMBPY
MCFRRKKASKSNSSDKRKTRDTTDYGQSVHPDCNSDTYTAMNMSNRSPDYGTLESVHPDSNSDTYTALNMKNRSPEYDTLDSVHPDSNSDTYTALNMRNRSPEYDTLDVGLLK